MPAAKTSRIILASVSNAAGASVNSAELDLTTKYGALLSARITNGPTGPTIGCDFVVYIGDVTGDKREFSRQTAPVTNNGVVDFTVEIPPAAMFINVTFTGNTGQAVTVECHGQELTAI